MKRGQLMKIISKKKFGQVWVETVIYTLIGLLMVALVLYYAKPTIEKVQDQSILQQSFQMLGQVDSTILGVRSSSEQKNLKIWIKKGQLQIDGREGEEKIIFEMESKYQYSGEGVNSSEGGINYTTVKKNDLNLVTLMLDYNGRYNLTIDGVDKLRTLSQAPTPYSFLIKNNGKNPAGITQIEFEIL